MINMKIERIKKIYFSPAGTTKKVIDTIADEFNLPLIEIDLFKNPLINEITVEQNELLIIALPVYFGRIPEITRKILSNLKGDNSLAIAVVVYGNREYDDSLLELRDILIKSNFSVIGASAFVAQHSLFPLIAQDRPDRMDIEIITDFSKKCNDIISSLSSVPHDVISVNGNDEYIKGGAIFIPQKVNENCTNCGLCATICPVKAIDPTSPEITDGELCLSCAGCITNCPQNARSFTGSAYEEKGKRFVAEFSKYKIPEVFYI